MDLDRRKQLFVAAHNALVREFGVVFKAKLKARMLGEVMQIECQLDVEVFPDWKPPTTDLDQSRTTVEEPYGDSTYNKRHDQNDVS